MYETTYEENNIENSGFTIRYAFYGPAQEQVFWVPSVQSDDENDEDITTGQRLCRTVSGIRIEDLNELDRAVLAIATTSSKLSSMEFLSK